MSTTYYMESIVNRDNEGEVINEEKMLNHLADIFENSEDLQALRMLRDKIYKILKNKISDIFVKDISEELEESKEERLNIKKFIEEYQTITFYEITKELTPYLKNNFALSDEKLEKIYDIIQKTVFSRLNEVYLYKYTCYSFPLWNYIKRQLLESGFWKKVVSKKLYEEFDKATSYKELNNYDCFNVVGKLVNNAIGTSDYNPQFEKHLISWYRNRETPLLPKSIEKITLAKIAYGFEMSLSKYDEMCKRVENSYSFLCYEDCMFRFAINYHSLISFTDFFGTGKKGNNKNEIGGYVAENRIYFSNFKSNSSEGDASKKIQEFFNEHPATGNDINNLKIKYIDLLKKIGVSNSEVFKEYLDNKRKNIAKDMAEHLLKKLDLKKVNSYYYKYSKYANSAKDSRSKQENKSDFNQDYKDVILTENANKIKELCSFNSFNENKIKVICRLCDGVKLGDAENTKENRILDTAFKPVINGRFSKILKCKQEIKRNDILRLGYLDALINFINNDFDNKDATRELNRNFKVTTDKLMADCCFAPLHITFNHDCLIYIALGSAMNDRCIPEVYQMCLTSEKRKN